MKDVFVDTGGWFGLLVPEDEHYLKAGALFRRADAEDWNLVTTDAVVFETYALLVNRARDGLTKARKMLDDLEAGLANRILAFGPTLSCRAVERAYAASTQENVLRD